MKNASVCSELHATQEELRETRHELRESQETTAQLKTTVASLKATHAKEMQESWEKIQMQEAILRQHQKTLEKMVYTGTLPFEFTMTDFEQHKGANDE